MAEPASSVVAGFGAAAITLTGTILGIHYDAIVLALLGGLAALPYMPTTATALQRFLPVISATLFGSVGAPFATAVGLHYFHDILIQVGEMPLRTGLAFLLGLFAQVAIPAAMAALKRKGDAA